MLQFDFSEFHELHTKRLFLRRLIADDAPQMLEMRTSVQVMQYIDRPHAKSIDDVMDMIKRTDDSIAQNQGIAWAICLNPSTSMIGSIGYWRSNPEHHRAEVGYMISPEYWNQGIVTEALMEVLKYGFGKMKLHSIEAHINPSNLASAKVLTKAGFVREALFRENYYYGEKFLDTAVYSLLERDFYK